MVIPLIETDLGILRGAFQDNITGGNYVAFKGVPYATPPLGDLRFRDPVPVEPWTGVRDAREFGNVCYQYDSETERYVGSEDCLYLNVYMPNLELSNLKAVMVWIHGGAFQKGSGNDDVFGVDYLIKSDVIIITLNYRMGCLGFLNLRHKAAPGNQGMKDQVMALRWVKQNIKKFGGDPNNVTIVGQSAGAVSVHYLLVSSMARGISATKPEAVVEHLRKVNIEKLIEAQEKVITPDEDLLLMLPFTPGHDETSDDPFFPQTEQDAIKMQISVPCIIGYITDELTAREDTCKAAAKNPKPVLPAMVMHYYDDRNISVDKVIDHYMDEDHRLDDQRLFSQLAHLITSVIFLSSIHTVFEAQVKNSDVPIFYYKFSFDSKKTLMKVKNIHHGCGHGDDLSFLFAHKALDQLGRKPLCSDDVHNRIIQRFVKMWTNFARTGNPTPKRTQLIPVIWEPIDTRQFYEYKYLHITDNLTMESEQNHFQNLLPKCSKSN
ncbi:juvenile hormone esterase-like isoform X2 [Diachasmimorpha longicaudata]|uniref:juvenile hormone esterase-like isoform X2 n=1 Tax=Diachasmimorpha longicaudata TaxID=58733 RepID=UPI0030B86F47